jgi:KTSC domain
VNLEEQYPNIWAWIQEHGTIQLGYDENGGGFACVFDSGGTCFDSDENEYDSLSEVFEDLEQEISDYCHANKIKLKLPKSKSKTAAQKNSNFERIIEVESSMISAVKYTPENKTLEVWFNNGQRWQYLKVPQKVFLDLLKSDSKGSYMRDYIIGEYSEMRVRTKK